MEPETGLFFHANLLHMSAQNRSENPRWSFICSYNAARNDPYKESHTPGYTPVDQGADEGAILRVVRRSAALTRCLSTPKTTKPSKASARPSNGWRYWQHVTQTVRWRGVSCLGSHSWLVCTASWTPPPPVSKTTSCECLSEC
jgi:hypothetical protein